PRSCASDHFQLMNCMESGNPSALHQTGIETVGSPQKLHGELNAGSPVVTAVGAGPVVAAVTKTSRSGESMRFVTLLSSRCKASDRSYSTADAPKPSSISRVIWSG